MAEQGKPDARAVDLIAPPHTAMNPDGSLNLDAIEPMARSLLASGCVGAFVCGSTGEFSSLTVDERMRVAQRWVEVAGESMRVIVHVGHTSAADCKALAAHAQRIGAGGVGCVGPFYVKPASVQELARFCAEVASAAPDLPFYYYHIPVRTGICLPMREFLSAAAPLIPNLRGLKFTHEDLADLLECLRMEDGRYDVYFGNDYALLAALALGVKGAVGTTYNYAAPLYLRMAAAFREGDMATARAEQARAIRMCEVLDKYGGLPASKAMMRMIGLECGPIRLPMNNLTDGQYKSMREELERIDFFEFCNRL